jgi:hypothetical protein
MSDDYIADAQAIEDEIRASYESEESQEQEQDSLSQDSTESQDDSQAQDLSQESTQDAGEHESTPTVETVDKSRYDNAVVAMNKAQQELAERRKQDSERDNLIQSLQSQLQSQAQQLADLQKDKSEQAKQVESTQEIDDDELKEANELYPELVKPLLNRNAKLEKQLKELVDKFEQQFAAVSKDVSDVKGVADRYQQTEQEAAENRYWNAIRAKHPDTDEIANSNEYSEWYQSQPPLIKQALVSNDHNDVISALDLYRASHPRPVSEVEKQSTSKSQDKLAAAKEAAGPSIKSGQKPDKKPTYTNEQIAKMSHSEFAKNEDAILEAMARGEIN